VSGELTYTNSGDGHTVRLDGKPIGRVRRARPAGLYWYAYTMKDKPVHGTFMSMSAAASRLVELDKQEGESK
jgi:hypothetical protein